MSTVAEIQSAIAQLAPDDVQTIKTWISDWAAEPSTRKWTSKELVGGARQMLNEPDPAKADQLWEEIVAGFYGPPVP